MSQRCCCKYRINLEIKNILLQYANDDNTALDYDYERLRNLSNDIHDFSIKYKRKQKK